MPWVAAVGSVAGALISSSSSSKNADTAAAAADPFASQRGQYQNLLSSLINGSEASQGGSTSTIQQMQALLQGGAAGDKALTDSAGYQFALNQGTAAIDRSAAANGYLGSTQEMAQLTQFGQGLATNTLNSELTNLGNLANQQSANYGNQYQQLAALSGANVGSPATAAQIQAQQAGQASALVQQGLTSAFGSSNGNQSAASAWYNNIGNNNAYNGDPTSTIEDIPDIMAFNLASGAAAFEMGQMINADLQEKQADVALKKQSLAEHQMAMQMQQQNQAKQQQYNTAMKNAIDSADASDSADKIADGTAPNPGAVDGALKAATQYKNMAKVARDYGQTDKVIELLKLANSERDKAGSEAKNNLEIMEKQNDLGARASSAFVAGDISAQDYFKQYADIHGVKAAMALPTDPEKLKAFAKGEIIKGESTAEHLNQGIRIAEADANRKEKAEEFRQRERDRAEERADRAMMREALLEQKREKAAATTKLSDDALNQAAYEKLFTGKEMSGMGNATADERIKARNRESEIIHSLGLTPTEAALLPTDTKAKAKALTGLTNWDAFVEKSQKQLDGTIDLAISTAGKLSRTDIQALNQKILAGEKEFGSGPAAAYAQQMNTWRTEYARLMSGPTSNGMLHVDAEKKADELISAASSMEQLKALKDSTLQEAKITKDSIRSQVDDLHRSMTDPTSNRPSSDKPTVSNW